MAAGGWARMKHAVEVARRWRLGPSGASDPDRTVLAARLRVRLEAESLGGAWAEGRAMSMQDAVALAVSL